MTPLITSAVKTHHIKDAHMVGLRHIQYQGETLPPPLVLAFHLVLGKRFISISDAELRNTYDVNGKDGIDVAMKHTQYFECEPFE